jgi:flavin reductase (DIM6/NTAB) family NADH-FMN oxidoreductase RutF
MKLELGKNKPDLLKEEWPGEYTVFSWMEYVTAIPQPLFLITTYKENKIPNACFHAWSTFTGEGNTYFVVLSLLKNTHTYVNIQREKSFGINFPDHKDLKQCYSTIENNEDGVDEISQSGFTLEEAHFIDAPRIKECFMNLECKFEWEKELFPGSQWALICGSVQHMALNQEFAQADAIKRCKEYGVMYNVHAPTNPVTGDKDESYIAKLAVIVPAEEG